MSATVKTKINRANLRKILSSPAALGEVRGRAQRMADAANVAVPNGHVAAADVEPRRWASAAAITVSNAAKRAEATDRNLTRSIDAGR